MNKPPVTDANITKWFNYLAEVIKKNGVGSEITGVAIEASDSTSKSISNVANTDIVYLQFNASSSQNTYKGCNLFDKDHMAVRRCDLDDNGDLIEDLTKIVIGPPTYGKPVTVSTDIRYVFKLDKTLFEKAITYHFDSDTNTYIMRRTFDNVNQLSIPVPFQDDENCISVVYNPNKGELSNYDETEIANSFMYGVSSNFSNDYEPYTGGKPAPSFEYPQYVNFTNIIDFTIKDANSSNKQNLSYVLLNPLFNGDTINTQTNTIIRNYKTVKIDDSFVNNTYYGPYSNGNTNFIVILINDGATFDTTSKIAYCDSLRFNSTVNYKEENFNIMNSVSGQKKSTQFMIMFDKDRGLDTLDKVKAFLKENPIIIYYKALTPEIVDISEEEGLLEKIKALHLYKPTSYIETNVNTVLVYHKKK